MAVEGGLELNVTALQITTTQITTTGTFHKETIDFA